MAANRRRIVEGIALFNAGYYWEAHEAWEGLWHAHGRDGPTADVLKGLIKLAAAGVKVREGRPHGVAHPRPPRGLAVRGGDAAEGGARQLGPRPRRIGRAAAADRPTSRRATLEPPGVPVSRVFSFEIEPR